MKFNVICPNCNKEHEIQFSLKSKVKKSPPKSPQSTPHIWTIVQHYLDIKKVTDKVQIDSQKGRLCKVAKKYLMGTGNDVELIKSKISKAPEFFENQGISWTLETVGRYWADIDKKEDGYSGWDN